ncbi:MAG: extracellular solute-binding protein, partial [Ardenticatenaceae bacterium]
MLRKRMWLVLALLVSALLLGACGGAAEPPAEEGAPAGEEAAEPAGDQTEESAPAEGETETGETPAEGETVTLVARCKAAPPHEDGRCNNLVAAVDAANAELAETGDNRQIQLEIIQDNKDWGDYKTEFELASDAGEAPDIIVSGHEHIGDWAPAGYIIPLTDKLGQHEEFANVIPTLWSSTEFNGERWGVPQDAEARPLYYSKPLLRELGWSEEEIESLPDRIASGEFTWQ